jgi:hypothetical protein
MEIILIIIGYVLMALALQKIGGKMRLEHLWMSWVPVLNLVMLGRVARVNLLWLLLLLVPLANIVLLAVLWWKAAEHDGKPGIVGVACVIPVVGLVAVGWLAFSR